MNILCFFTQQFVPLKIKTINFARNQKIYGLLWGIDYWLPWAIEGGI